MFSYSWFLSLLFHILFLLNISILSRSYGAGAKSGMENPSAGSRDEESFAACWMSVKVKTEPESGKPSSKIFIYFHKCIILFI